jgi:hypothetical protein
MKRPPAVTALVTILAALPAAASTPITLDQAMANPDWIGPAVDTAWWRWDGKQVFYQQKRDGAQLRDTWTVDAGKAGRNRKVDDTELGKLDSATVIYDQKRTHAIMLRNGDLFERDLKSGALVQIWRANGTQIDAVQYAKDERGIQFRIGDDWFGWDRAERLQVPLASVRAAKDPNVQDPDALRDMQLRLIATLKRQKDERDAARARAEEERRADPTRAPAPVYLGDKLSILNSHLSPDGR